MKTAYHVDGADALISSVRVEVRGAHAEIGIWNRGGKAGSITVNARDADLFVSRLITDDVRDWEREE